MLGNAAGTTTFGAMWLAGALLVMPPEAGAEALVARLVVVLAIPQGVAYACAMVLFFWVQRRAGAVFTAQVGYVATLTGIVAAAVVFGERLSLWAWGAAAVIALGAAVGRRA